MRKPDANLLAAMARLEGGNSDFRAVMDWLREGKQEAIAGMASGEGAAVHRAQGSYHTLKTVIDQIETAHADLRALNRA